MQEHRIDPRFRTEPHGNHIDINQLYGYREQLRANRYLASAIAQQRQTLLERIDAFLNSLDDPMRVVVAGGFNAGKSTFLNALVKRQLMPVKAVRSTCTINTLKAGDCEELIVVRRNGRRDRRKYDSDEHIREQISVLMQNEHASIAQIEICCPNDLFLQHFTLIDTPGLDHNADDSATSAAEVEQADALIWVLHNKGAEKLDHEQILRFRAANPDSPVIVILNQIDSLEQDECDDALAAVKSKLGAHVSAIFPLSARLAYEGQHDQDQLKLNKSQFFELDRYLHLHLFNQYRDLQEKIRFNQRSQSLLHDLRHFITDNEGAERMGTIDITPTIQQARERYQTQKATISSELKKQSGDRKNQRFHESAAIKAELVNVLTCTSALIQSEELLSKAEKQHLDMLIERIKDNKFSLGVFGSMKAGKSTFINTLLGCGELLPVNEERCTAAHTVVTFADTNNPAGSMRIVWKKRSELLQELQDSLQPFSEDTSFAIPTDEKNAVDWIKQYQSHWTEHLGRLDDWDLIPELLNKKQDALLLLEALPRYETIQTDYARQRGSLIQIMTDESAIRLVDHLMSYQNLPILQHIDVIDSPGSGSTTLRDTIIAQRLIKTSDALLFLSEASTAFQKDNEMRLLHHVRQNVQEDNLNKLFIVATKVDRSERKPEEIAKKISERLARQFKDKLSTARIYPVSCHTGLNFEHFTADLNRFLQEEKDRTYLSSTNTQVEGLLKGLIGSYENELTKKEQSLQQIQEKIGKFQEDADKIQRLFNESIDLSYRDVVTRSKEKDEFTFQSTLERLHKQQIEEFKDGLIGLLKTRENKSSDGAKAVMASASTAYIKDLMGRTALEIQDKVEELVAAKHQFFNDQLDLAKVKLEKDYCVLQTDSRIDPSSYSVSHSSENIGNVETSYYDWEEGLVIGGLLSGVGAAAGAAGGWAAVSLGLASTIFWPLGILAGAGLLIGLAMGSSTAVKNSEEMAEMAVKSLNEQIPLKEPKGEWKPLKQLFDDSLEKMVEGIVSSRKELLNRVLNDIQQQLDSQLQEQQKTEAEKQLLHANRQKVDEELRFLKQEQAAVGKRIEAVYGGG